LSAHPGRRAGRPGRHLAAALVALVVAPTALVLAVPAGSGSADAGAVPPNSVRAFGAASLGDLAAASPNEPVVGMATTAGGGGYWLVASDGGVFAYGDATFHGSTGDLVLAQPIVGMAGDPATGGYWLVASDGGVFAFDAPFDGSEGGQPLAQPIVGMAAMPDGGGYWLVARDGGVFSFGDATFHGSEGGQPLNAPVVAMAATGDGGGYWLAASDGGIFNFGDAAFHGSEGGQPLNAPVVAMAATGDGGGYWLVARDGGIFNFGDAPFDGSALSAPDVPAVGIGGAGADAGYRVAYGNAPSPFGPAVTGYLAQRADDVTMAVYDANTGATWDLHPGQVQVTASIVKVDVMAAALAADQSSGGIPPQQAALMAPMIEVSDNNAATAMWSIIGGAAGLGAFDRVLGLQSTTPYPGPITATNLGWAYSTTSADDMVRVVSTFAFPNAILSDPSRAYGLSLMHSVEASQVWGVPTGAPAGSVAVKTGFITPAPGDAQVNSIGYVSGAGRNYVFAILTYGNPSEVYGESTINTLSSLVFDALAPG
jgi:hypothetical protein